MASKDVDTQTQKLFKRLQCPNCHELMTDPRVLPCTHRMCYPCIVSLGPSFNCPRDSEPVKLPDGGVDELNKDMQWAVAANALSSKMFEKEAKKPTGVNLMHPEEWDTMTVSGVTMTELDQSSEEFKKLEQSFRDAFEISGKKWKGAAFNQIISIKRIQNLQLHLQYETKKMAITKRCESAGAIIERRLWHGTSGDVTEEINKTGFNRNFKGKNATKYGQGVYFSTDTAYSSLFARPDSNGHKHMYQARVLTGEYCLGTHRMLVPPMIPRDDKIHYDSVVNDESDPMIFVIFYDAQSCPDYLITFT